MLGYLRQDALGPVGIVVLHRVFGWDACIAVRNSGAILENRVGVRIPGGFELLLQQAHSIVEEVGIGVPNRDVQLAFELGTIAEVYRVKAPIGAGQRSILPG